MKRCITDRCIHHHGTNPNGTCRVERVGASVANVNGWRSVFDHGKAGGSFCWHPDRREEKGVLF
jgi:hypothetical protein